MSGGGPWTLTAVSAQKGDLAVYESAGRLQGGSDLWRGCSVRWLPAVKPHRQENVQTWRHALIVIQAVLLASHVFLPASGEEKARSRALNMLCHFLLDSSSKTNGYHLSSSLLTCGSSCLWERGHSFSFCPALCSSPRLHTSPSIVISLICIPRMPCYLFFCVFLFCLMAGGSHSDRNQTTAMTPPA